MKPKPLTLNRSKPTQELNRSKKLCSGSVLLAAPRSAEFRVVRGSCVLFFFFVVGGGLQIQGVIYDAYTFYMHIYIYIHIYTCICMCLYIYIYMYVCIHTDLHGISVIFKHAVVASRRFCVGVFEASDMDLESHGLSQLSKESPYLARPNFDRQWTMLSTFVISKAM